MFKFGVKLLFAVISQFIVIYICYEYMWQLNKLNGVIIGTPIGNIPAILWVMTSFELLVSLILIKKEYPNLTSRNDS
jgi:hypothetical protein